MKGLVLVAGSGSQGLAADRRSVPLMAITLVLRGLQDASASPHRPSKASHARALHGPQRSRAPNTLRCDPGGPQVRPSPVAVRLRRFHTDGWGSYGRVCNAGAMTL
jgi:hypothetical protein